MAAQIEDRIASLKAKKDALAARLNKLQARAKTDDRKRDTRRKIVVGAAVLAAMEKDSVLATKIRELLLRVVTRENDRAVVAELLTEPNFTFTQGYNVAVKATLTPPPASPASKPKATLQEMASLPLPRK